MNAEATEGKDRRRFQRSALRNTICGAVQGRAAIFIVTEHSATGRRKKCSSILLMESVLFPV